MSLLDGFLSLGQGVNKLKTQDDDQKEGPLLPSLSELELSMKDDELIALKVKWEQNWQKMNADLSKIQEQNEAYWLGKHWDKGNYSERPVMDNLIFESIETLLPIASRQNPEPIVYEKGGIDGDNQMGVAHKVQKMLIYLADTNQMKLKNKKLLRYWMLYRLGVAKVAWNVQENDISYHILRPQKLILDPDATVTEKGVYTGEYIGEHRKASAQALVDEFPKQKEYITGLVSGKMGTEIGYIEWWTDKYSFSSIGNQVLKKFKNPHWNYDAEEMQFDQFGNQMMAPVKGNNHFSSPQKPYIFLSVFNLGKHPFDDTSLIEQNLSNQDSINKRKRQIDKNADQTNGGIAVNSLFFSKEEGAAAAKAKRDGGVIMTPGNPNDIIANLVTSPLPNFVYQDLQDSRGVMLGNFGVRGSTPQGIKSEDTVRGKIITKGQDESRISGITEYLEQFMDRTYNWMVQLMYVYYDEIHTVTAMGKDSQQEQMNISNAEFSQKLLVSVKEGSTVPKDDLTKANQAIDLWSAGALDPITLYERLQFPDPIEQARRLVMYMANPMSLFPGMVPPLPPQTGAPPPATGGDVSGVPPEQGMIPPGPPPDVLSQVPLQ